MIPTIAPAGSLCDWTVAAFAFPSPLLFSAVFVDEGFGEPELMADATGAATLVTAVSEADKTVSVGASVAPVNSDVVAGIVDGSVIDDDVPMVDVVAGSELEVANVCMTVNVIGPVKLKSGSALAIGCPSRGRRFLWRARSARKRR